MTDSVGFLSSEVPRVIKLLGTQDGQMLVRDSEENGYRVSLGGDQVLDAGSSGYATM